MMSGAPFLISVDNISEMLPTILADSVILDNHFVIRGISQNVLDLLRYTRADVQDKDLNCLVERGDLVASIQRDLTSGFASEKRYVLFTREKANYGSRSTTIICQNGTGCMVYPGG